MRFEVEAVIDGKMPFVLVRAVEPRAFQLTEDSTLGGVRVRAFELPRAVGHDGQQRKDVYGFIVEKREDLGRFSVGQRVDLKP